MDEKFRDALPGISFDYSQYIEDDVDEALSGVKAANSIKVLGPDLRIDEDLASRVMAVPQTVPGNWRSRQSGMDSNSPATLEQSRAITASRFSGSFSRCPGKSNIIPAALQPRGRSHFLSV
jgi:hypothetical protein